jgi:hypothetical protein
LPNLLFSLALPLLTSPPYFPPPSLQVARSHVDARRRAAAIHRKYASLTSPGDVERHRRELERAAVRQATSERGRMLADLVGAGVGADLAALRAARAGLASFGSALSPLAAQAALGLELGGGGGRGGGGAGAWSGGVVYARRAGEVRGGGGGAVESDAGLRAQLAADEALALRLASEAAEEEEEEEKEEGGGGGGGRRSGRGPATIAGATAASQRGSRAERKAADAGNGGGGGSEDDAVAELARILAGGGAGITSSRAPPIVIDVDVLVLYM